MARPFIISILLNLSLPATHIKSISLPAGGSPGIALCNNINVASPSPTFYCMVSGVYYYYNGSGWTSTGHTAGGGINFGGGEVIYMISQGPLLTFLSGDMMGQVML